MKNTVLAVFCTALLVMMMSGCPTETKPGNPDNPGGVQAKYEKEFLGEWIRTDTGELWYISGNAITVNGAALSRTVTLEKTSAQEIKVREAGRADYFLFASRVANAGFKARVVFIDEGENSESRMSRSLVGNTGQLPPVKISNPKQPELPPLIVQPDPATGEIAVPDQIPGDKVEIVPDDPEWGDVKVELTPWDDQDMGIIPLAKGVNLKTSIRMASSSVDITELYADGSSQNYVIEVENIGTENCIGASYQVSWDSEDFTLITGSSSGNMSTIVPGGKGQINLALGSKPIAAECQSKTIQVTVTVPGGTSGSAASWEDTVSVNYYKESIPFRFKSEKPVQGVIQTPLNKSYYFKTEGQEGNCGYSVDLPRLSEDYLLTFLGTFAETKYSLAVDADPPADWDSLEGEDMFRYETANKSLNTAPVLALSSNQSFMYYLNTGAVQYYRVNLATAVPGSGLAEKLAWLQTNARSGDYYSITVSANENISNTDLSYSGRNYIKITLKSTDGECIIGPLSIGPLFTVGNGVTLTLDNITLQGRNSNNNDSLVKIDSGGTLVMNKGSHITGNRTSSSLDFNDIYGGGVYVAGTFTMNDGKISANSATFSTYSCTYGGGVYVSGSGTFTMNGGEISGNSTFSSNTSTSGGGVHSSGTFIMNGGKISENSASASGHNNQSHGGGVSSSGTFIMNGGEISGNSISSANYTWGGGVRSTGTFTMNGGEISGNTANNTTGNTTATGGGVSVSNRNSTFTMNGGKISGNTASSRSNTNSGGSGGGVCVGDYTTFTMHGGEISGNTAQDGGGVHVMGGVDSTFTMNGGEISGNAAQFNGGGVSSRGIIRIVTGTIYGSGEAEGIRNTAGFGVAFSSGTAQYGTFSGSTWNSNGSLNSTNDTIRVVNGVLMP